jgi:cation diffusion facilitator CzcD-associated flavoprotein CzcO
MSCEPTKVPPVGEIDIPATREKYRQERDKRLRTDGQKQYAQPVDDLADNYAGDPHMPVESRPPLSEEIDVVILGGGFSGILAGVQLRKAGVNNFRNIDHAGDFGGVWYWNRYPGVQCDNDAYCYLPLLEEMGHMPTKKFDDGPDIYDYCRKIATRFALYENALFHTMVSSMRWDDTISRWRISTDRGDAICARFVIMANGLLNIPKLPEIPGIHDFKGTMFHTARWDYDYTGGDWRNPVLDKLADKRVALVGTGATAIQAVPYLGRYAKQFYLLQRTPSTVDKRYNTPTDPAWVKSLQPGWQKARQDNFHRAAMERFLPGDQDLVCDFWTELSRNLAAELEAEGWPEVTPEEYMARREEMDYRVMERLRRRVESIVEDPDTAEALKPWYRFLCKRPLSNEDYYETFNRENVELIDVSASQGIEALTGKGFVAHGVEYEIDCMIFASGFEVTSDLDRRWGIDVIEGRDGLSIYDDWANGYKTLHGMMSHGFPNQFYVGYYQGGLYATTTEQYNRQNQHIAYIISEALERGASSVEPSLEAQNQWLSHLRETAIDNSDFVRECTPSYFNNEGEKQLDSEGNEKYRFYLGEPYGPGWGAFQQLLQEWRDKGDLDGLVLEFTGR